MSTKRIRPEDVKAAMEKTGLRLKNYYAIVYNDGACCPIGQIAYANGLSKR